jgi:hypothetical protein
MKPCLLSDSADMPIHDYYFQRDQLFALPPFVVELQPGVNNPPNPPASQPPNPSFFTLCTAPLNQFPPGANLFHRWSPLHTLRWHLTRYV